MRIVLAHFALALAGASAVIGTFHNKANVVYKDRDRIRRTIEGRGGHLAPRGGVLPALQKASDRLEKRLVMRRADASASANVTSEPGLPAGSSSYFQPSGSHFGALIAGLVIGALILVVLLVYFVRLLCRSRGSRRGSHVNVPHGFNAAPRGRSVPTVDEKLSPFGDPRPSTPSSSSSITHPSHSDIGGSPSTSLNSKFESRMAQLMRQFPEFSHSERVIHIVPTPPGSPLRRVPVPIIRSGSSTPHPPQGRYPTDASDDESDTGSVVTAIEVVDHSPRTSSPPRSPRLVPRSAGSPWLNAQPFGAPGSVSPSRPGLQRTASDSGTIGYSPSFRGDEDELARGRKHTKSSSDML